MTEPLADWERELLQAVPTFDPTTPYVTPRVAGLMQMALDMIDQAIYEGDHVQRSEYSADPRRPDLPSEIVGRLRDASDSLRRCIDEYVGDPVDAMREFVGIIRPIDY